MTDEKTKKSSELDAWDLDLEALGLESCSDCECMHERSFRLANALLLDASICGADVHFCPQGDDVEIMLKGAEDERLFSLPAEHYEYLAEHLLERSQAGVLEFEPMPGVSYEFAYIHRPPPDSAILRFRSEVEGCALEVDLPSSVVAELEAVALRSDQTLSEIVRRALEKALELDGSGVASECVCPRLGSATEREIVGVILDEAICRRLEAFADQTGLSTDAIILRAIILTRECLGR